MVARSEIERRVGDGIVKGVGEAYATITDRAKIDPVLGDVFSVGPGNIIGNVVDGSHAAYIVCWPFGAKTKRKLMSFPVLSPALVKAWRV